MTRSDRLTNTPDQAAAYEQRHGEDTEYSRPWNEAPTDPRPLAVDDGDAGQAVTCGEHDLTGTHEEAT